jgi:hypothetical protein
MKKILFFIALLTSSAQAAVLRECITLTSGATVTATSNGSIVSLNSLERRPLYFTGIVSITNNSGTTPTLDVTIQTCKDETSASCVDTPAVFTQCTTGSCSQRIDLNMTNVNVYSAFRSKFTAAGTSPNYTVTVELCHE